MPKATTTGELVAAIGKLTEVVEKLDKKLEPKKTEVTTPKPAAVKPVKQTDTSTPEFPIPQEYKEIVNTVLNQDFGIAVTPLSNTPAFQFEVLVPKEYSNAGENYWSMYGEDRRPKVISYSEGVPVVKEWVEQVYKNLGQDIQVKINLNRKRVLA